MIFKRFGNDFCPGKFDEKSPVILPSDDTEIDPPELQFYRARPFYYFDRWIAAIYYYAPSLLYTR